MRRRDKHLHTAGAWDLFQGASTVQIAGCTPEGRPVLRTLNTVVWREGLAFHAAHAGEKLELLGQPVVAQVQHEVALIPSHWMHPERACPATCWYRSAQLHGRLVAVEDLDDKAEVLQAIMARYQPEGGHRTITAHDPMYTAVVRGLLIGYVRAEDITGKLAVGQNYPASQRAAVLAGLWRRGAEGDVEAIDLCRDASPQDEPAPDYLAAPEGARLRLTQRPGDVDAFLALARESYWNLAFTPQTIAAAQEGSTAWVGATDCDGALIGSARAVSDGAKHAWIGDVYVSEPWRARGLGQALMRTILDHPRVRGVRHVSLRTRDAMRFYERFGFEEARRENERSERVLTRG
jgi:GNAT superfamily N-acetyltransferase/predicted FMN-binding regulatory protein PaiB